VAMNTRCFMEELFSDLGKLVRRMKVRIWRMRDNDGEVGSQKSESRRDSGEW
jgi:hypothetical protein